MTEERRSLGGRGGGALGPRAIPIFPSRAEPFFCYPAPASLSPLARRRDWAKRSPRERDLGGGKESSTFERWGLKEQPARAHPLFLIPLPQRGRGSRRGGRRLPRTTGTHRGPAALRSRWPACGPRPPHSGRGARGACRERSRRNRARSLRLHSPIVSFAFGSGWPQRPTRFARDDQQRKRHRFARYDEMSPSPLSYGLAMGRECR